MKIRHNTNKSKIKYKQSRISIYLDKEFKNELYPKLKELAKKEARSINFIIKKAVKQILIKNHLIKSNNET